MADVEAAAVAFVDRQVTRRRRASQQGPVVGGHDARCTTLKPSRVSIYTDGWFAAVDR